MSRKLRGEKTERLTNRARTEFQILARQSARWVADNLEALKSADPMVPDDLNNRAVDNWRLMLAIADLAGGNWPSRARAAAVALSGDHEIPESDSRGIMLLADLSALFTERQTGVLASAEICKSLIAMEGRPWPEHRHGKPITPNQVAKLLRPYSITPATVQLTDKSTAKGYRREWFKDAFARYLSTSEPSKRQSPTESEETTNFVAVNDNRADESEKCGRSHGENDCDVLAYENPSNPARVESSEQDGMEEFDL